MPAGRPSSYTEEIAQEICDRLATGEPLAQICRDEHMPAYRTVSDWKRHEAFSADFTRARDEGFDAIAAQALHIADTQEIGETLTEKPDGSIERKTEDMLGHRRLRIETRLKLLAKWDPKRYGDRLTHSGDAENPVEVRQIVRKIVDPQAP